MEYLKDWLRKRKAVFTGAVTGVDLPKGILLLEELVSTGLLSTVMVELISQLCEWVQRRNVMMA